MTASYRSENPKVRPLVLSAVRAPREDRPAGSGRAVILAFPGRKVEGGTTLRSLPPLAAPVAPALSLGNAPMLFLMGVAAMALARFVFWVVL